MLMDDKQKEYLSALEVGNAIVFSEHTEKPIHVHIKQVSNTNEEQIENDVVRKRFLEKKEKLGGCYEFLEVAGLLKLFGEVATEIRKMDVNVVQNKKLIKKIKEVSKHYNMTEEQVWYKLILRYDNVSGKAIAGVGSQEERVNALVKFFSQIFVKEDFSDDDIFENCAICCINLA